MILKKTESLAIEDLIKDEYDLFIAASGYEKRSAYLTENYNINARKKICICFDNYVDSFNRKYNDLVFQSKNFFYLTASADSYHEIKEYISSVILNSLNNKIKILVDYSSMSRVWYSYILSFFSNVEFNNPIEITFSYSHSLFVPPPTITAYKSFVAPIEGYYSILPPIKPTALIIGLGYIERQAFGLAEYFEAEPFLFISKSSESDPYYDAVLNNNKLLLEKASANNIFYYSLNNLTYTETILNHLCRDLQSTYRIVLAPCGPKPFTLINFITSIKLTNIDVWRISAGSNNNPVDKIADGNFSIIKVHYTS